MIFFGGGRQIPLRGENGIKEEFLGEDKKGSKEFLGGGGGNFCARAAGNCGNKILLGFYWSFIGVLWGLLRFYWGFYCVLLGFIGVLLGVLLEFLLGAWERIRRSRVGKKPGIKLGKNREKMGKRREKKERKTEKKWGKMGEK